MAVKDSSRKPPHSSSSPRRRKSRWEPAPSTAGNHNPPSSAGASSFNSKPAKPSSNNPNPSSDKKSTPKRGDGPGNPNRSPSTSHHPKVQSHSVHQGSIPSPGDPYSLPGPPLVPPPPPSYGFHMLERQTIILSDGSTHSYFALPPDYQDFFPPTRALDHLGRFPPLGPDLVGSGRLLGPMSPDGFLAAEDQFGRNRNRDYWNSLGLDDRTGCPPEVSMKRKYREGEGNIQDELARQRQHLRYTNVGGSFEERNRLLPGTSSPFRREDELSRSWKVMRVGGGFDTVGYFHHYLFVDPASLKKAFLIFAKLLNENGNLKKNCLEDGKRGPVPCIVCGRSSKDFPDVHGLLMHAYNPENADLRVNHLGLHKALCVLMGWNYMKPPDNSREYQFLPADEAATNQDDLIVWPPMVMIHNTSTGKGKDGRMEGLGKKAISRLVRGLGFLSGKPKALYNKDGHLGIVLIKFAADQAGLREAIRLEEYFEMKNCGRRGWAQVQSMLSGKDEENNPSLVKVNAVTGEKKRIYYGHLFTAFDLDKVDEDTKKSAVLGSKCEYLQPK